MKKLFRLLRLVFFLFALFNAVHAGTPLIGAQVWIEPGQTPEDIDRWFRTLAESGMPVARLFLMWNYLEPKPDVWDFTLFDLAFQAAEKHRVKIVATLTDNFGPTHRIFIYKTQDGQIPKAETHLKQAEVYIRTVVSHYKDHPALDSWMLMNEPGQNATPDPYAIRQFRLWLQRKYITIDSLNTRWLANFQSFETVAYDDRWNAGAFAWPVAYTDWRTFWREHLTRHMAWLAEKIRETDALHPLHVNPHALVGNVSRYDLPAWRAFLNSLGASIHPSWHFGLLKREQYPMGVAYVCDMVRGASEPNPFWVTELQGGNNIFSASNPSCPTAKNIAQWVWTAAGSGAERVVFWLLNARRQGGEAGEWSLCDFHGRPSERLQTASSIAKTIYDRAALFDDVEPVKAPVTILLSLETMVQQARTVQNPVLPERGENAHVLSALAFYGALSGCGIPAEVKFMDDYDWEKESPRPRMAILPHVTVVHAGQAERIRQFVRNGNKLLAEGLTGYFGEYEVCLPLGRFPLEDLFGAKWKEIRMVPGGGDVVMKKPVLNLLSRFWIGEIENQSADPVGSWDNRIAAIRKKVGTGEAVWIPSTIGLGAWFGDSQPFARWVQSETQSVVSDLPFRFSGFRQNVVLRTLKSKDAFVTVLTNGNAERVDVPFQSIHSKKPEFLWGEKTCLNPERTRFTLGPDETVVVVWK